MRETGRGDRILALWCPDWPAAAAAATAGVPADRPVAVVHGGRIVACTAAARADGVRRGLRRREAQARCAQITLLPVDPDRDARAFAPVVAAVGAAVPAVEVLRPGLLAVPAHRAVRVLGGEDRVAEPLIDAAAGAGAEAQIGIADELTTAVLAARAGRIVPPGRGRDFVAPVPLRVLVDEPALLGADGAETIGLLHRLGVRTLGDLAALPRADLASRFGQTAVTAHRWARDEPGRAVAPGPPAAERAVTMHCDPPIDRVDAAAFAGRRLAERLHRELAAAGLACTRLRVRARTAGGREDERVWRCVQPLTAHTTVERVRWQLDGWLSARGDDRPDGPIVELALEPVETVDAGAIAAGVWEDRAEQRERAHRAVARVQSLLGGDAVLAVAAVGGRGPAQRLARWTWGEQPADTADPQAPWPGRIPPPSPSWLPETAEPVELLDAEGLAVLVSGRGMFTAAPAVLRRGRTDHPVRGWAGPWPVDEHWWDPERGLRGARAQIAAEALPALLLLCRDGRWTVEGCYR